MGIIAPDPPLGGRLAGPEPVSVQETVMILSGHEIRKHLGLP